MFSSSKVSQAMIDAVNSVLSQTKPEPVQEVKTPEEGGRVPFAPASPVTLSEAAEKVSTPTGMKVYGSSYGDSKKARADQLKRPVDDVKRGPTTKELTGKNEELKGNQSKIDANHNNKIDSQDFAILRGKKKVKESLSFADRLLETVRKSDVPAYLRKAKGDTPLTVADVKGPKKDSISAPENLAKNRNEEVEQIEERDEGKHNNGKTTGFNVVAAKAAKEYGSKEAGARVAGAIRKKVLAKEEVELHEDNLSDIAKKHGMELKKTTYGAGMTHPTKGEVSVNRYGEWNHYPAGSKSSKAHGDSTDKFSSLDKHLSTLKEGSYEPSDAPITTDTLAGRLPGGKVNSFKSYKKKLKGDLEDDGTPVTVAPESTAARRSIKAEEVEQVEEKVIAGTPGWKEMKKDVKDKSGAIHTPMSRAKDLARSAFKKIQKEVK